MSYFNTQQLERTRWRCGLNLYKYFTDKGYRRGFFKVDCEYVATWYAKNLTVKGTVTYVEVNFINLTEPYYQEFGDEKQSFCAVKIPLNYLHKIPFGSIWINGKSAEKFVLNHYTVRINQDRNNIFSAPLNDTKNHPFESDYYVHPNYAGLFKKDKNVLLTIWQNGQPFIIHPLHFFMGHYGYSGELKRILLTYNWEKVRTKLCLDQDGLDDIEKTVVLPQHLSHKDAVFLYHAKYDNYTKEVIKTLNSEILFSKGYQRNYEISCWHQQEIQLSFYGIKLGDSILCCQITGISQPQGEAINLVLPASRKYGKSSSLSTNEELKYRIMKYERDDQLDELDVALNPINNLVTVNVYEQLRLIGKEREINKLRKDGTGEHAGNIKTLPFKEAIDYGVGEPYGALGNTGIANCFYDVTDMDTLEDKSRLATVWEHATRLRTEIGAKVFWYTLQRGFSQNDNFRLISLKELSKQFNKKYPSAALVLRIDVQGEIVFVISFPQNEAGTGFSSLVYKPENLDKFLSYDENQFFDGSLKVENTLINILIEVMSLNAIQSDYVDAKNGRMATFKHREGKNNNWVRNGLEKVLDIELK